MLSRGPSRQRFLAALLGLYLAVSVIAVSYKGIDDAFARWNTTDFFIFYRAAQFTTKPYRGDLYDLRAKETVPPPLNLAVGNYFNPPLFAFTTYGPLTLITNLNAARHVFVGAMVLAGAGIVALTYAWSRRWDVTLLALLAIASYMPMYDTFRYGHVSALFALISGLGLYAMQTGRFATSGVLVSLLALKPSIAIAPLGLVAWLGKPTAIVAAGIGLVVFVLLPFYLLGPHALSDYRSLLSRSQEDSFTIRGGITAGAPFMFNWNGFIARLFLVSPRPVMVVPLYVVTALLMARVWVRGDLIASWLAATLATLLAMPHMLWYDWVLLLPVGIAYGISRPTVPVIAMLVVLHLSINVSNLWYMETSLFSQAFVFATPVAFLLLAYVAFEPEPQPRPDEPTRAEPAPAPAAGIRP